MKHILTYIVLFVSSLMYGQAGMLDNSFSTDGISYGPLASGYGIAFDASNNIFVVGDIEINDTARVSIIKFKTNGVIDSSFGANGLVAVSSGLGDYDLGSAIIVQDDQKIVVVGTNVSGPFYYTKQFIIRLLSNGALDNSFGSGGVVILDFDGEDEFASSLLIQPDGKYLIAGTDSGNFTLSRIDAYGNYDLSFGLSGKKIIDIGGYLAGGVSSILLTPNGNILFGGYCYNGQNDLSTIFCLNQDGSLDNNFDGDGILIYSDTLNQDRLRDICLQPDGKIIALGNYHNETDNSYDFDIIMRRFNSNGNLDSTFGNNGVSTIFYPEVHILYKASLQVDGKILAGGVQSIGSNGDYLLLRFNSNGDLDSTFGVNGRVVTDFYGGNDFIYGDLVIDSDLKILTSGIADSLGSNFKLALVRYLSGLTLGMIEFSQTETTPLLYPNPLQQTEVLKYTLSEPEQISISLIDGQGKLVTEFVKNENRAKGEHEEILNLPPTLPSGTYFIQIASTKGSISIKAIK
jgi:uncharacterized delta-60 repeat protein